MGVGNQRVVVREIALPFLPEKELRASLGFQVQEFIPMPVDDAVLDYDRIGEFEQEGRRMLRLLLVAAQRGMVDQIVAAAVRREARAASGLDLIPFAMVRAVGTSDAGMDLEEAATRPSSTSAPTSRTSCVHARGHHAVRAHPSLGRPRHHARDRPRSRRRGRRRRALKRGEAVEDARTPPTPEEVQRLAIQRATAFVDEIRSSLEFYTAQAQGARIERVSCRAAARSCTGFLDLLASESPPARRGGCSSASGTTCPFRKKRWPRPNRCSPSPSASPSRGVRREPGQPPSRGDPRGPSVPADRRARWAPRRAVVLRPDLPVLPACRGSV